MQFLTQTTFDSTYIAHDRDQARKPMRSYGAFDHLFSSVWYNSNKGVAIVMK